jgi:MtN3 and saliva related transmembrane protein
MGSTTVIGVGASIFTIIPLLPSFFKLIQERKVRRTSLIMFFSLSFGLLLWILYGVLKSDWIIVLANVLALSITIAHQLLILYYKRKVKKKELYLLYYH